MSKILIINPIASSEWNQKDEEYLKKYLKQNTDLKIINLNKGPSTIESYSDQMQAAPEITNMVKEYDENFDGIIINCFADPALEVAREISRIPIFGAGESALLYASTLPGEILIISTSFSSLELVKNKIHCLKLPKNKFILQALEVGVKDLKNDFKGIRDNFLELIYNEEGKHNFKGVLLGCTGMNIFYDHLKNNIPYFLVEPFLISTKKMELELELGLLRNRV